MLVCVILPILVCIFFLCSYVSFPWYSYVSSLDARMCRSFCIRLYLLLMLVRVILSILLCIFFLMLVCVILSILGCISLLMLVCVILSILVCISFKTLVYLTFPPDILLLRPLPCSKHFL